MIYSFDDTIAAIATAPGQGAIAIIRLSGKKSFAITEAVFSKSLADKKSHTAHYGKIYDKNKQPIDSVLTLIMKAPNSYTGEDSIEIHCHGSPIIAKQILERLIEMGARPANPGEFTYRAYTNHKIDLSQAEAVQELIASQNELSSFFASQQLEGKLSLSIIEFQKELIHVSAQIEAYIDFPEEDIDPMHKKELLASLASTIDKMQNLSDTYHDGKRIFQGLSLCIAGTPNVGKSSLLNALLKKERAIVTPIAGTTRDLLEETLHIGAMHFHLIDTAGIRNTEELIEKEGILRSKKAMKKADYILLVLDASKALSQDDRDLIQSSPPAKTIIIWNKIDLSSPKEPLNFEHIMQICATKEIGIDQLKQKISSLIWEKGSPSKEEVLLSNLRHKKAIDEAIEYCQKVSSSLNEKTPYECIAEDLRSSLSSLNTIIGVDLSENILSAIFSKFCIGK